MQGTLSSDYWDNLYKNNDTGWDIGFPTPPLKEYIDQLSDKSLPILIPGCGNAYEAEYLLGQGFYNVTLIDIAPSLTAGLEKKFGKRVRIVTGDFFEHAGKYDLILEQTFLSALDPVLRPRYVDKMHAPLSEGVILPECYSIKCLVKKVRLTEEHWRNTKGCLKGNL
jgi:hypothetical protein